MSRRDPRERGFSLLEVVVALAVLGLVLAALADALRAGLLGGSKAASVETMLALAEAKIAAVGVTEPLTDGRSGGTANNGGDRVRWQIDVARTDAGLSGAFGDTGSIGADTDAGLPQPFRVAVTVSWDQGGTTRSLSLETIRLAPPERRDALQ
ncbi:MAG TPA: prepilin-type N-terminal cleavage/methylation domain-containing protein [Stellaceae bacterium]